MRYIVMSVLVMTAIQSALVRAAPEMTWAEYHGCQYGEGHNASTMAQFNGAWNRWMDSEGNNDYTAVVLSPLYRSPSTEIEVLWVGITDSNETMATNQSDWRNSDVYSSWPAPDCSVSMLTTQLVVSSFDPSEFTDEMVVAYWMCTMTGADSMEEVYAAHKSTMDAGARAGAIQGSKIIVPRQGAPARFSDYDFMVSYTHPSMAQWGKNVDDVWMNGKVAKEQAAADALYQCGEAVVYTGEVIRRAQ